MFGHTELERVVKEAITESPLKLNDDAPLSDEFGCKTFVLSVRTDEIDRPVLMRTYSTRSGHAFEAKIWEAARATSAMPTFFEPVIIDGLSYADAAIGWNNPTNEAIIEAGKMWPNRAIGCLVSIGSGLEKPIQLDYKAGKDSRSWLLNKLDPKSSFKLELAKYCVDSLTSCEKIHQAVSSNYPDRIAVDRNYFRWNVPQGLSNIGLEEWMKVGDVVALTDSYMGQGDMKIRKIMVARLLTSQITG
jgi:hypothetical protein